MDSLDKKLKELSTDEAGGSDEKMEGVEGIHDA